MDEHSKIDALVAEVARFGGQLEELSPDMRLQAAARLRDGLGQVAEAVVNASMTAAASNGLGLRRIGRLVGLSHETVRSRISRAADPGGRP